MMLKQEKQLEQLQAQLKAQSTPNAKAQLLTNFVHSQAVSPLPQDCLLIDRLLSQDQQDNSLPRLTPKETGAAVAKALKEVNTLPALLSLHAGWERSKRPIDLDWRHEYERKRNALIGEFNKWTQSTSHSDPSLCNLVLSRVMANLPMFLQAEKIRASYLQFDSCLVWMSLFAIKSRDDHLCALRTARLVKEVTDIRINDYQKKQHLILRRIVELLGEQDRRNNSLYLFFDRFTIRLEDIEYFINIKEDFFQDLDEKHLCNVFLSLVQPGLNKQILQFFRKVSALLRSNEQYFILRTLFEQIVLPVVAAKYKTHHKLGDDVFQFVLFYIAGFLAHCYLGQEGLKCILENLQDIELPGLKKKWAELALLCCKDDQDLKAKTLKELQKAGMNDVSSNNLLNFINRERMVWTVTMHNGRKLKKYPQIQSNRFKGIQNLNNQCYIISVVQALYTTEELRNIVGCFKAEAKQKKLKVVEQLRMIFETDLNIQSRDIKATVKYLKNVGPQQFRTSHRQEDAQQYLVKLFECLEEELKKTAGGEKMFQEAFRTEYYVKIICRDCKVERELKDKEYQYINTYSTKQNFQLKKEERLDDNYKCQKCGSKKCVKTTTMYTRPKVLILHINRFRQAEGEVKKILGNNPIKRQIEDYRLVGFIAHKGSHIHAGHYQYYGRVDNNRWALFNDNKVTEFNITEDEDFERQFRAQNTPYILFYRQQHCLK